ncbi:MAG: hypothetical protein AB7Q29_16000 [Vicinamibacterales bacterium]
MPGPNTLHRIVFGGASSEGSAVEPPPPPSGDFDTDEIWSLMHLGIGGVPISGALEEDDQEMMLGLYSGHDYT